MIKAIATNTINKEIVLKVYFKDKYTLDLFCKNINLKYEDKTSYNF